MKVLIDKSAAAGMLRVTVSEVVNLIDDFSLESEVIERCDGVEIEVVSLQSVLDYKEAMKKALRLGVTVDELLG